ncbi:PHP domain-containing protein [Heliobacillus mobilis]|uniref:PHP domain-containing protein n=1 Tax=Heliobacterium mobile TaxID=28064 RepID=A0A6I3SGH4_HELMO|nr:PHP domain-containing protein [Heliobacterium mobile]MTV47922.1 PHP domain-containing protein [Heliobacterium mobile]
MKIDLHLHTTASDGLHSPLELLDMAAKAGLTHISITDHESVNGCFEIAAAAQRRGVRVIPGVELLVTYQREEVHLLGYGVNLHCEAFKTRLTELREARTRVAKQMVQKLQEQGVTLSWQDVLDVANPGVAVSKGHIVYALYKCGLLNRPGSEFIKHYLNPRGLAHVEYLSHSLAEGVELIRSAGGVAVIAHPGLLSNQSILPDMIERYPVGLEVFYGYYGPNREKWVQQYYDLAVEKGLLMTGGTDYHGPYAPFKPGGVEIPDWVMADLEAAIARNQSSPA